MPIVISVGDGEVKKKLGSTVSMKGHRAFELRKQILHDGELTITDLYYGGVEISEWQERYDIIC